MKCLRCGEKLDISPEILNDPDRAREFVGGWMAKHVDLHGGNPDTVMFEVEDAPDTPATNPN